MDGTLYDYGTLQVFGCIMVKKQHKNICVISNDGHSCLWTLANENGLLGHDDICLLVFRSYLQIRLFLPFIHLSWNFIFSSDHKVMVLCGILEEIIIIQDLLT